MSDTVLGWLFGGWSFGGWSRGPADRRERQREEPSTRPDRIDALDANVPDAAASSMASAIAGIATAELVARIRASDRAAFGHVYEALFPTLWRIAVFHTRDTETASDIVQDVFLSLWTRRESLGIERDLRGYCIAAVRRRVRDLRAHQRVVIATEDAVAQERLHPPGVGQAASPPNAAAESREMAAIYQQAVADLDAQDRTVVVLRWEEGYSFEEIAQAIGISKNGARHILLRAERIVQRRFAEYRR